MLGGYVLAGLVLLATATLAPHTSYAMVGTLFFLLGVAMVLAGPATLIPLVRDRKSVV